MDCGGGLLSLEAEGSGGSEEAKGRGAKKEVGEAITARRLHLLRLP
jgi:hypothetical protein